LKGSHVIELERVNEKKDYEKDKAILETEREYQQKLLQANEGYNEKIKQMYDEINSLRKEYDKQNKVNKKNEVNKG
jgi:hypothetical protein